MRKWSEAGQQHRRQAAGKRPARAERPPGRPCRQPGRDRKVAGQPAAGEHGSPPPAAGHRGQRDRECDGGRLPEPQRTSRQALDSQPAAPGRGAVPACGGERGGCRVLGVRQEPLPGLAEPGAQRDGGVGLFQQGQGVDRHAGRAGQVAEREVLVAGGFRQPAQFREQVRADHRAVAHAVRQRHQRPAAMTAGVAGLAAEPGDLPRHRPPGLQPPGPLQDRPGKARRQVREVRGEHRGLLDQPRRAAGRVRVRGDQRSGGPQRARVRPGVRVVDSEEQLVQAGSPGKCPLRLAADGVVELLDHAAVRLRVVPVPHGPAPGLPGLPGGKFRRRAVRGQRGSHQLGAPLPVLPACLACQGLQVGGGQQAQEPRRDPARPHARGQGAGQAGCPAGFQQAGGVLRLGGDQRDARARMRGGEAGERLGQRADQRLLAQQRHHQDEPRARGRPGRQLLAEPAQGRRGVHRPGHPASRQHGRGDPAGCPERPHGSTRPIRRTENASRCPPVVAAPRCAASARPAGPT